MREILFRGKRIDNGEWTEGDLIHSPDGKVAISTYDDLLEAQSETVCQYTGLTDRNGRKIFEGDIVKAIYKPKDGDLTVDDFVIKWDKYYCKFVGHYAKKENVYNPLLFGSQTSFEVIGNIFDNPELVNLEEGKIYFRKTVAVGTTESLLNQMKEILES